MMRFDFTSLRLSRHATQRNKTRRISLDAIERVVRSGEWLPNEKAEWEALGTSEGQTIKVVFAQDSKVKDGIYVVTLFVEGKRE